MKKVLRSMAAVGAAVVALFGQAPAGAAVVIATFDPLVGPQMPNTAYRGSAQVFVDDACLLLNGIIFNNNTCSANTMAVQSGTLEFYDPNNTNTVFATLTFPGTGFTVNAAEIAGGEILGFDTSFGAPSQFLQLDGFVGTVSFGFVLGALHESISGVDLQLCPRGQDCVLSPNRATDVKISRVPEPATLALVGLAALGAAGASRRRKAA